MLTNWCIEMQEKRSPQQNCIISLDKARVVTETIQPESIQPVDEEEKKGLEV